MRFYASFSLAFGLVAASPCKPVTSGSTVVSAIFSSSATEISSTLAESATSSVETLATETSTHIEFETTTAIDTTVTAASTLVGSASTGTTDVTITASETSSQPTSGTTTAASTETTAVETSVATTTTAEASITTMATTTTSEEPVPTDHFLIAGRGLAQGFPLKSTNINGDFLIFGERTSQWTAGNFIVDPTTGYLTRDGVPACARYRYMNRNAALVSCTDEYHQYGTSRLVCARNPAVGTAIQCSAVKLDCVANGPGESQGCTVSTEAGWTKFFISTTSDHTVYLGADDLVATFLEPVDIFVDRAPPAAAQTAP
ncbi:hypothetical protein F52700_12293 [Fusarium sp. NRRL 52700]|nr:hypothetical protein F52700_12293 [Fusarium sp. NRRL 52700]